MSFRAMIIRHLLRSGFAAVGLNPSSAPQVVDEADYARPTGRSDAVHVVVAARTITTYAYTADPREASPSIRVDACVDGFMRGLLDERVARLATIYLGSSREAMAHLKAARVDQYLAEQRRVEAMLAKRKMAYLKSARFAVLRWLARP